MSVSAARPGTAAFRALLLAGGATLLVLPASSVLAQDVTPSAEAAAGAPSPTAPSVAIATADATPPQGGGLADIVVTARRRTESVQDVPVSV
ncbi:MAG: hypothetical protein EOP60_17955, partial [Sphingomonadales bacterium]